MCGALQIVVDLAILYQVFHYGQLEPHKVKNHVAHLNDHQLHKITAQE